jgi:hypothetical protein
MHMDLNGYFDAWKLASARTAAARLFTRLAIKHSSHALLVWSFAEYAFATRIAIEERAAALYHTYAS